jgi:hypothetical protein
LICAPGLPQAIAVKIPAVTPNPHPVAITIQPAPSAFDFFSKTLATTPSPNRIKTIVPMNSPNSGPCIIISSSGYLAPSVIAYSSYPLTVILEKIHLTGFAKKKPPLSNMNSYSEGAALFGSAA